MRLSDNKKSFLLKKRKNRDFIFYRKIRKFNINPIPGFISYVENNKYSFLYESLEKGKEKGRFSICGFNTIRTIMLQNKKLSLGNENKIKYIKYSGNPLLKIDELIKDITFKKNLTLPPMACSFFGYLSYENIYNLEHIQINKKKDELNTPDIILFIPEFLLIYDNFEKSLFIIKHFLKDNQRDANYDISKKEIENIENNLIEQKKNKINYNLNKIKKIKIKSNINKAEFLNNIKIAKKYIKEGDIFQVVPSQRFETNFHGHPSSLYRILRQTNPSPFMYYFNLPQFKIIGSSPEILVRIRDNKITIRPIAGTRPRGKTPSEDKKNQLDLITDKKELSEHLMLLDLGRNDVGKVSKKSSVKVTAKFIIEKYSHVMHIVSNVTGTLNKKTSLISALMAGFPAGTVTGAPKIRAMQIIDELEKSKRGIYAGGIGYFSPWGNMDTCIVLRTGIIKNKKLYVQAGGGIVYDSNPQLEYLETVNKAKAVLNAAAIVLGNEK